VTRNFLTKLLKYFADQLIWDSITHRGINFLLLLCKFLFATNYQRIVISASNRLRN
jgi:hypothetical protein